MREWQEILDWLRDHWIHVIIISTTLMGAVFGYEAGADKIHDRL